MLRQMGVPRDVVGRFRIVESAELRASRSERAPGPVYVSPLVPREPTIALPSGRRIRPGRYLAGASIEELKAQVALDLALDAD